MKTGYGYVRLESSDSAVAVLTIDRAKQLNALNTQVLDQLGYALTAAEQSEQLRCLVITGAGEKAFVAGADIAEIKDLTQAQAQAFSLKGNKVMERIECLAIPVIAAVNGYALGGGFELTLCCDIRIAAQTAVFALPEAGLGILPGYGGVQRLARTTGLARAKELALTTRRVKAPEALALGIVNQVVESENLMEEALAMARVIAANAPVAVQFIKQIANESAGLPLAQTACMECKPFGQCFATQDQKEGMAAFLEKRAHAPYTGK